MEKKNTLWVLVAMLMLLVSACQQKQPPVAQINQQGNMNPWTHLDWNNDPENFQFVIVTDRTGGMRQGIFEQGVEKVNLLQPEFVMSVGDLIEGYTVDTTEIHRQWEEFDAFVKELDMPFFYVPGNHDITNQVMEDIWKQRLGATYYHFVYRDVLFLCLNSEEGLEAHRSSYFSEVQREYVRKALADNPEVRWTFAFLHKPIWLAPERDNAEEVDRSGWGEIEAMLEGRPHTVFAGHVHRYTYRERKDNKYISLATTGGSSGLRGPLFGQFDHVMWVTMTDEGPIMANLMMQGIWDDDFSQEDREKYLRMYLENKAVRLEKFLSWSRDPADANFEVSFHNPYEVPMHVRLSFGESENYGFKPQVLEKTLAPNVVEKQRINFRMSYENPGKTPEEIAENWQILKNELSHTPAQWQLTLDFGEEGKFVVKGSSRVL